MSSPDSSIMSWLPLNKAMARYCEPYFSALTRWKQYKDIKLIENRILLLASVAELLKSWAVIGDNYNFGILSEFESELLPEVLPQQGLEYQLGQDKKAFNIVQDYCDEEIFKIGGWFFQSKLLVALAGWNEEFLTTANINNRDSITQILERIFRLQESSGQANIIYYKESCMDCVMVPQQSMNSDVLLINLFNCLTGYDYNNTIAVNIIPQQSFQPKSHDGEAELNTDELNNIDDGSDSDASVEITLNPDKMKSKPSPAGKTTSKRGRKPKKPIASPKSVSRSNKRQKVEPQAEKPTDEEVDEEFEISPRDAIPEEISWSTEHPKIAAKVAKFFGTGSKKKLYIGIISGYSPAATEGGEDEMYHVVYEDGDEEDFDRSDLSRGENMYKLHFPNVPQTAK